MLAAGLRRGEPAPLRPSLDEEPVAAGSLRFAFESSALRARHARAPNHPHLVALSFKDPAGEERELRFIDLDRRVIEGAHREQPTEILVEPVLQRGRIILGGILEPRLGEPVLPGGNRPPGRPCYRKTEASSRDDRPDMPHRLPSGLDFG